MIMRDGDLYVEIHEGDGPYLLLVHGILSGRSQWRPNLAALATVSRPVVVELRGHGRSPSPEDPSLYHPEAYVRAFETIREEIGADRWLVCGQSFGAALTLRYALDHPGRVIAQAFTNSTSALADPEWVRRTRETAPAMADAVEEGGLAAIERMPMHPRHATRIPEDSHRALLEDAARLDPAGVARTLRHAVAESSVLARIGENRVPTLLVCGDRERRFAVHRELAERSMPHLEVVRTGGGHAVNLETPEEFDRAVVDFFERET